MSIHGWVERGFEPVKAAFLDNFDHRRERGAGFEVWHRGRPVVQLWGGVADPATGRAWEHDTTSVLFSATKGLVAIAFLMLHDQGLLDLDAPVARYWPRFGQRGKGEISVRTLLNHRSGLSAIDRPLWLSDFVEPAPKVTVALEQQRPMFPPGSRQAYGATAWGAFTSVLFRRIAGMSVGRWLTQRVTGPLEASVYVGLSPHARVDRAHVLTVPLRTFLSEHLPEGLRRRSSEGRLLRRALVGPLSAAGRALLNPIMLPGGFAKLNDQEVLGLELPWMNGVGSARGLARVYAALVSEVDGVRLVRPQAVDALRRRQSWSSRDGVLQKPTGWSQGFVKEELHMYSPNPASFGHPGAGGVFGWADPDHELAMAYVMNQMDWRLRSPRALALAHATYASLR